MKRLLIFLIIALVALALAGCSGKRDLDPNYLQYLSALDAHAQNAATQDRTLVRMVAHDGRPIQIDAASYEVRLPPAPLPVPEQFRDFTAEMTVAAWRDGAIALGGPLAQGLWGYLGKREDRKIYENLARYGGSPTLHNEGDGTLSFGGGWGDRQNIGTGALTEGLDLQPYETRPEVVVVPGGSE